MRTREFTERVHWRLARGLGAFVVAGAVLAGCSPTPTPPDSVSALLAEAPKASSESIAANEWARSVQQRGTLRVGGTQTSQLFSLLDPETGELTGFDAGLAQLLSYYILGEVAIELTQVSVETREDLLASHAVDAVIATYSITPSRAEIVDFAGPYLSTRFAVLVKRGSVTVRSVEDLAQARVVTQAGSTAVDVLAESAPGADVRLLPDNAQALAAVKQGRADAYVTDESLQLSNVASDSGFEIVGLPFGPRDDYGIGVPQGSDAQQFVNEWLRLIVQSGVWRELWIDTIGANAQGAPIPDPPDIAAD